MQSYQQQRASSSGGIYQTRYMLRLFSFLSLWLISLNAWAYAIQGTFVNIDGKGVAGVTVSTGGVTTSTNANGAFELGGLAEGTYSVTASGSGYKTKTVAGLYVGDNMGQVTNMGAPRILVATTNSYRVKIGVMELPANAIAKDATVQIGSLTGTLQPDNYYYINLSDTSGTVTVSKPGYNSLSRNFGVNDDNPVSTIAWFYLVQGGYKVKGRILDIDKNPVAGVQLSLNTGNSAVSKTDGTFEIAGITKETYSMSFTGKLTGYKDVVRSGYYVDNNVREYPAGDIYMVKAVDGFRVMGCVSYDGNEMSNVQVTVGEKVVRTGADGCYNIGLSNPGNYNYEIKVVEDVTLAGVSFKLPANSFLPKTGTVSLTEQQPTALPNSTYSPTMSTSTEAANTGTRQRRDGLGVNPNPILTQCGYLEQVVTITNKGDCPLGVWNLDLVSEPALPSYLDFVGGHQHTSVPGGTVVDLPLLHTTYPRNKTGANNGIGYTPGDYLPGIKTPLNCNLANDPATPPIDSNFPYPRSSFGSGNPSARILECRDLGFLPPSASTKVNVVIAPKCGGSGGGGGGTIPPFKLYFKAAGKTCKGNEVIDVEGGGMPRSRREGCRDIQSPPAVVTVPEVLPNLNLTLPSATTQVRIAEGDLSYVLTVRNDAKENTVAKNVTVTIPNVPTTLATSYTTDKGTCTKTTTGSIQCRLQDLPSGTQANITLKLTPKQAPLNGSLAAQLTSQDTQETPQTVALNYTVLPALTECEKNPTCDCTPKPAFCAGIPDLSIVFDDTGSMSEEINGLRKATTDFVTAIKAGQIAKPTIQLVTFKDNVSHRVTTDVPDTLQNYVNSLAASGGADCPEFSTGALDWVVSNTTSNRLRDGGRILLVTDASPPHNADMDAVIKKLVQRGIKVDVLISGDACVADGISQSTVDAYSQLANETHGYFAKVFEINDGTAEGKKKYEDTARQVLFGAIFPTILGVDPNKAPQESTLNVNLTAANTNFNDKSTVTVQKGDKALVINTVKVISATELVANVTVPEGIDLGAYDVKIETKLGSTTEVAEAKAMLEVTQPSLTPDILSITPTSAMQNYAVEVAISGAGTHFFTGLSKLSFEDDGILVKSLQIDSKNALTATLEISSTARLGMHTVTVTTGSEVAKSPKELFLVMQESLFAKLKEITPHRGRQGGMVRVNLVGGNTNFEDGKSEIKFNGRGLTPLALTVQDATHATATLMVADNAPLGFQDVFVKTGDEIAVLLKGFEVLEKGCHTVEGYVLSQDGPGIADIYVATEGQGAFTDATGFYRLTGLTEGEYTLTAGAKGYHFDPQTFYIGGQHTCETSTGETVNKVFTAVSNLAVKISLVDHFNECVKQDGQVTYNVTVTNTGTQTATGVVLTDLLPANTSLAALDGVNCNLDTASCALPDLGANGVATVKVTLHNTQDQPLLNKVTVASNEYPPATATRWKCVAPHLSVSIKDTPDPVTMLGNLTYLFDIDLSQYAPTKATGVKFSTRLPQGVEFKSIKTPVGTCDTSQLPAISCDLGDFSIDQPTDISHTTVTVETVLKDAGLLLLTTEATVSAKEYTADLDRERTTIFVPPDLKVDIALVIDTTESMQEEINGVVRAIKQFLAKVDVSQRPSMALVTFKDEVTVKAFTQDLDVLLGAVADLKAEGGNTCPEASVEALNVAIKHLKDGGSLLFSTDASPYEDADVAGLETLIKAKNMKFNALITGDCTTAGSWNGLTK